MKAAAIGIGANSLRMLIADIEDRKILNSVRYREGLRVFAALDEQKNISPRMIDNACQSVLAFKNEALEKGVEKIHPFATSATRDANNQDAFIHALNEATGLELDVCSGDEEACLSFWGASGEGRTGVIDIGGGSTEIAVGQGRQVDEAVSLQMGAVRLFRKMPIASVWDAEKVVESAGEILLPVRKRFLEQAAEEWVGVGGTFTTSAAVVQRIPWQQRQSIHRFTMTQQDVKSAMDFLAPMPLEERLKLPCLQPQRADIVVHGIAILLACMRGLHIPAITVSEHGNLEGYLKMKYIF